MQKCKETFGVELSEYMEAMESDVLSEEVRMGMKLQLDKLQADLAE